MSEDAIPETSVEDIILRTQRVSCADNRIDISIPREIPNHVNHCLLGKIMSLRSFYMPVVLEIVTKAWNPSRPIQVKKVERNIFVFMFEHEADMALAYKRRPWTIRGAHLILKVWNPELTWQEIDFSSSTFWVQVHGLPPSWHQKEYLEQVGSKAGKVLEVDFIGEPRIHWQRFVRIRVNVEVTSPLCPGIFLPRKNLSDI